MLCFGSSESLSTLGGEWTALVELLYLASRDHSRVVQVVKGLIDACAVALPVKSLATSGAPFAVLLSTMARIVAQSDGAPKLTIGGLRMAVARPAREEGAHGSAVGDPTVTMVMAQTCGHADASVPLCNTDDLSAIIKGLLARAPFDFEVLASKLAHSCLGDARSGSVAALAEVISHLLRDVERGTVPCDVESVGLLLDWLSLLDPRMVSGGSEREEEGRWTLTMGQSRGDCSASHRTRCLLSIALEASSGYEVETRLAQLLRSSELTAAASRGTVSSAKALDFLLAAVRHPRRWLGTRDIDKGSSACMLSSRQAACVATHVVRSMVASGAHLDPETSVRVVQQRAALLLQSARTPRHLDRVVAALTSPPQTGSGDGGGASDELIEPSAWAVAADTLLAQMCFLKPHLTARIAVLRTPAAVTALMGGTLDAAIQRAVAVLHPEDPTDAAMVALSERSHALVRKMALSHSQRMLRFMPSLGLILGGVIDTDAQGLLFRRVDVLCERVVGLVEVMRPLAFDDEAVVAMGTIVPSLIDFLRVATGEDTRLDGVVRRACGILVEFAHANGSAARSMLSSRIDHFDAAVRHCIRLEPEGGGTWSERASLAVGIVANHVQDGGPSGGLVWPKREASSPDGGVGRGTEVILSLLQGGAGASSADVAADAMAVDDPVVESRHNDPQLVEVATTLPRLLGTGSHDAASAVQCLLPWLASRDEVPHVLCYAPSHRCTYHLIIHIIIIP